MTGTTPEASPANAVPADAVSADAVPEEATPEEVLFEKRGHLGVVTLNRPKAVNALTAGMVAAMLDQLTAWAYDDGVATVLVQGSGGRGLCAGGDIVAIYRDMLAASTADPESATTTRRPTRSPPSATTGRTGPARRSSTTA